jgi:hypothetical protein
MSRLISLRRTATPGKVPTIADMQLGELAINTYDGKVYLKKNVNGVETIVTLGEGAVTGGPQGPQGAAGPTGGNGVIGSQGSIGNPGPQGVAGPQGNQGPNGDQGPQGIKGDQGFQGDRGFQGFKGDQGAQGIKGDKGDQGFKGDKGDQGFNGTTGNQGFLGPKGDQGFQGQGTQGPQGLKGDQGYQGIKGDQGFQGNDGYIGADGNQGRQGPQGDRGYQGTQGGVGSSARNIDVYSATSNQTTFAVSGGYVVGMVDVFWNGVKMTAGIDFTATNRTTITLTNPSAAGDAVEIYNYLGSIGSQGNQGIIGNQGTQGNQGYQGAQGNQGYQGAQGSQGYQGNQGPKGDQGFQGRQGPQGNQGPQGDRGFQGFKGDQGNQGPTGIQGTNGTNGSVGGGIFYANLYGGQIDQLGSWMFVSNGEYYQLGNTYALYLSGNLYTDSTFTTPINIESIRLNHGAGDYIQLMAVDGSGFGTYKITSRYDETAAGHTNGSVYQLQGIGGAGIVGNGVENYQVSVSFQKSGPQGYTGPQGIQGTGNQGRQGPGGSTGMTGFQGFTGMTGFQGFTGMTGMQGFTGPTGTTGSQGSTGTTGSQGSTGTTGAQGNQGPTGIQGTVGTTGFQGNQGPTGLQGTAGINGSNGSNGAQGNQGPTGLQGTAGTNGAQGNQGPTGLQGTAGINGSNGNTGAQGNQGPTGLQGTAGTNGTNGSNGAQGATGAQGTAGTNGTNGSNGAQGAAGSNGSNGAQGSTGAQGTAGTNGTNGSNGAQGFTGAQGTAGTNGTNGSNGVQGATGAQGSTGAASTVAGPQGNTGAASTVAGPQGATGAQGTAGTNGTNGTNGTPGGTGPQGAVGAQGGTAGTAQNLYGPGGSYIQRSTAGTSYSNAYQIRETNGYNGNTDINGSPLLGFHWSGVVASSIRMNAGGEIQIVNNPGTSYENFRANYITNARNYIAGSTNNAYLSSSDWGMKMVNDNGYIQFGPANNSWAHIYSDKSFYFNQELYVNNQQVIHSGNIGSQSVSNAATAGGLSVHTGRNNEANKIVRTDGNGYIQAGWINSDSGNMGFATRIARIQCSDDNYIRYQTLSEFKVSLGLSGKNVYSRRIDYTADANYHVGSFGNNGIGPDDIFHYGSGFFDHWAGGNGTYPPGTSHVHGFNALHYTTGYGGNAYGWQMASQYNQTGLLYARWCSGGSFSAWQTIITSANIGSASVSYASSAGSASTVTHYASRGDSAWYNVVWATGNPSYMYSSDSVQIRSSDGSLRVNMIYDNQNTGYYLDLNGYSYVYSIESATSMTAAGGFHATANWFRAYGDCGLYTQDYGGHFRRSYSASHGTWELFGYNKGGYAGINIIDPQGYWNNHMYESGNGGVYQQNGHGWLYYYHLGNNCMGLTTSTTSSSYRVYVPGSLYAEGDIVAYSDARLKRDIVTIDNPLDKVNQMRGVFYTKIGEETKGRQTGVIAQEINEVLPEVVTYAPDIDTYGVSYGNIVGVLIEAIKELNDKIAKLEAQLASK